MGIAHEKIEKNIGLLAVLVAVAVSLGGLAEIVPMMYQAEAIKPLPGVKPYPALELAGRDVYVREGCYNCHSQMVRTLRFETERYGHYSLAGESVYDRPHQWGSKRTGPDLARVCDWLTGPGRPTRCRAASPAPPWMWSGATSTCASAATTATRRWCARCAARPNATATTRWPASRCTTARTSGAPSAPGRTWRAWAAAIPTTGTGCT